MDKATIWQHIHEERRSLAATLADQIDRLILKRQPLLFGSGIPLFGERAYRPAQFEVVESIAYESGVVFTELTRRRDL